MEKNNMRIRLNENELYEIKLPEEITINELPMILSRLNTLVKGFSRFSPIESDDGIVLGKKEARAYNADASSEWKYLREHRDVFVEILNKYYNGTFDDFQNILAEHNVTVLSKRAYMSNIQVVRLKEFHSIRPTEVGMRKWPTKTEPYDKVRIKKEDENDKKINQKENK
jgi:hypothetical protein